MVVNHGFVAPRLHRGENGVKGVLVQRLVRKGRINRGEQGRQDRWHSVQIVNSTSVVQAELGCQRRLEEIVNKSTSFMSPEKPFLTDKYL